MADTPEAPKAEQLASLQIPKIGINLNLPLKLYDVNEGVPVDADSSGFKAVCRLPSATDGFQLSVDDYARKWTSAAKSMGGILALSKDLATSLPPSTQSFGRISYMPNNTTSQLGVLQWPGLPAETLEKLAREMIGPQMIIGLRMDDILKYAEISDQPWRPGWQIKPINGEEADPNHKMDEAVCRQIRKAEQFLMNSGDDDGMEDPRLRDQYQRLSFSKFLLEIIRNSLTFDGIAIWTECDQKGRIRSYAPLPAQQIRLLARPDRAQLDQIKEGSLDLYGADPRYKDSRSNQDDNIDTNNPPFAVAVDETGNIVEKFTRSELIWYVRNPRVDATVSGYGYSELEIALTLVTGFNNAIQFNADIFDKNSIPKGILAIKGNFTQRQFDALGRIWDNLQRGSRTDWTLPAIQLSEKGEIEVINLEPLRKEPAYYNNLINLFMGALSTVYRIPVHRLGYKISGTERDSRPDDPKSLMQEDDVGLPALLTHIEILINEYLLGNRFPGLKFYFTGKSLKEDARHYEAKMLSATMDEKRALVGLPKYSKVASKSPMGKILGEIMGMAPVDPAMAGIFQSALAALAKGGYFGDTGEGGDKDQKDSDGLKATPGARFSSKKDPAVSEEHGHMSGVRRDSKKESAGSPKHPPGLRRQTKTYSSVDKT